MELGQKRNNYSSEFKRDAVKLVKEGTRSAREVAKGLGLNENVLYRWIKQYNEDPKNSFPGKGHLKPDDEELHKLRKQLMDVTEERDILKKAISIFSKTRQ